MTMRLHHGIPLTRNAGFVPTSPMRPPPLRFARFTRAPGAFTLIELLAVVVIIATLVGLLFPVLTLVRSRMDSTQCLSQLRQIGVGINAYVSDHTGLLPGPLNFKQSPTYTPGQSGSLPALLESYLGTASTTSPAAGAALRYSPLFACPAAARQLKDATKPTYLVNMLPSPEYSQSVWGDASLNQQPLPNSALMNWSLATTAGSAPLGPAQTWAIQDADQYYASQVPNIYNGPISDLLPTQAHGDHWNDLYFDFHAASRSSLTEVITPVAASTPAP